MSRIGKKILSIPQNVKVNLDKNNVHVEGPKGKLDWRAPLRLNLEIKDNALAIRRASETKIDRALHGTARSIIANMLKGVSEGYKKELEITGVGYRAQVSGKKLTIQLSFSHPVEYLVPEGITVATPKPTNIVVTGVDKAKVGQVAADIRAFYPPEPYKGKGIRYTGEYVRKKAGKAVA